jgi:hypothetical protein
LFVPGAAPESSTVDPIAYPPEDDVGLGVETAVALTEPRVTDTDVVSEVDPSETLKRSVEGSPPDSVVYCTRARPEESSFTVAELADPDTSGCPARSFRSGRSPDVSESVTVPSRSPPEMESVKSFPAMMLAVPDRLRSLAAVAGIRTAAATRRRKRGIIRYFFIIKK